MPVFADMTSVMEYAAGDTSEETKARVFEALEKVFLNIALRYAPNMKFDYDFKMDLITHAFDRIHRPYVDFQNSKWRAYSYVYTAMRNALTAQFRKKTVVFFEHQGEGEGIAERTRDVKATAEGFEAERGFQDEFQRLANRMEFLGLGRPNVQEAMEKPKSLSFMCLRVAVLRELMPVGVEW